MAENSYSAEHLLRSISGLIGSGNQNETLRHLLPSSMQTFSDSLNAVLHNVTRQSQLSPAIMDALAVNTQALAQNTSALTAGGLASGLGRITSGALGNTLGLSPLISGLAHLFDKKPDELPELVKFSLPSSLHFAAANLPYMTSTFPAVDYDQSGHARINAPSFSDTPRAALPIAANIQVNVQAMDSRSFIDHSHDIAKAVREAMLNMHALNDVVTDL